MTLPMVQCETCRKQGRFARYWALVPLLVVLIIASVGAIGLERFMFERPSAATVALKDAWPAPDRPASDRFMRDKPNADGKAFAVSDDAGEAGFGALGEIAEIAAAGERRLFEAKRAAAENAKAQLIQKINQFREEARGISAQRSAKDREAELVREEMKFVEDMHERKLVNKVRLIGMQREMNRFDGERESFDAQIARIENQIAETELKVAEVDQDAAVEVETDMLAVESEKKTRTPPPPSSSGFSPRKRALRPNGRGRTKSCSRLSQFGDAGFERQGSLIRADLPKGKDARH